MNDKNNQESLEKDLIKALLADRRTDRRWRNVRVIFFCSILLLYAFLIFKPAKSDFPAENSNQPYVSLVRLEGVIMPSTEFSATRVLPLLAKAFRDKNAKGVVIEINSPGGSPVQATIIHDKILQLKQKYKKKVVIVGDDMLASGAYLVATAGDKIFVHKDTLTGSIGVILSSFGLTDAIQKLGISRRVYTAGLNKDRLDPFKPETPEDAAKIKSVINEVHQNFIDDVVAGRQGKLRGDRNELFSGDFWSGTEATRLGLADGTANLWDVLQNEFGVSHYRSYAERPSFLQSIFKDMSTMLHLKLMNDAPALKEQLGAEIE